MKQLFFLATVFAWCFAARSQVVLPKPVPPRFVTDKAELLSGIQRDDLEKRLVAFADSTTIQIAIVTIPTLDGASLETYALRLFNNWGIGQKDKNNGLLILVAAKERKVRIEVGRGLERYVTNEDAAIIIRDDIVPYFKKNKHYLGLLNAITALCNKSLISVNDEAELAVQRKANEPPAFSPDFNKSEVSSITKWGVGGIIFSAFFALLAIIARFARLLFPGGWNYGRHHYMDRSDYYSNNDSVTDNSVSDTGNSIDFGGGDSDGGGASDSW